MNSFVLDTGLRRHDELTQSYFASNLGAGYYAHTLPKDALMNSGVRILLMTLTGLVSGHHVLAAYPERPIRMIVPSAAGGQPDTNSRLVAAELSKQIGQQVVVDNRPGASSSIGFEAVARAQPDGYTIGYGGFPLATNPSLLARVPYDVNKDFRMVILTNISPNVIAITPALPVNSIRELIDYAKRNPDQLFFGQIIGGRLQILSDNVTSVLPHVTAGRLRALGVTGPRRIPLAPDIPTVAEAGVPGYEITAWGGYIGPAGMPGPIVARLNAELNKVIASPMIRERWLALGIEPVGGTPARFAEHVKKETSKWTDVIKRAGIKGD